MNRKVSLMVLLGFSILPKAQSRASGALPQEQRSFSAEDGSVWNSVPVPSEVLELLEQDGLVQTALKNGNYTGSLPQAWFSASVVHLSENDRGDLVIEAKPPLSGANVTTFWVFLANHRGYELVLSAPAHDLLVRKHISNGYLDIEMIASTAQRIHTARYRFDGSRYQIYREKWEPIR